MIKRKTENIDATRDQIKVLMDYMEQDNCWSKYLPVISLLFATGLRYSEGMALTWDDVDLIKKTVDVNKTMKFQKIDGRQEFHVSATKTKSCVRVVYINDDMVDMFIRQREYQQALNISGDVCIDGKRGWVFTDENGYPITFQEVSTVLEKVIKSVNERERQRAKDENREPVAVDKIRPYMFRHAWMLDKSFI